ncbi:MAG UNVERIFIED_CONTAM: hypothetical protein LVR29_08830 [Microcystis novacekii LVE1205-3]|jgi:hypothetical protein
MDIQNLLEWTDKQVLDKTGKHLDSLQESILQGIWEHQDYEEIAKDNQRSYDHIKKKHGNYGNCYQMFLKKI